MNDNIDTRFEVLLAKIAGDETATLENFTPPVEISRIEALLTDIAERLNSMTEEIEDAAATVPAVTAEDNGDVMTVVNGAWGKAAPSGGGASAMVVHIQGVAGEPIYTMDKTAAEIETAMEAGTAVTAIWSEIFGYEGVATIFCVSNSAESGYYVYTTNPSSGGMETFLASTGDDYPSVYYD